jgi:hypothetical protein
MLAAICFVLLMLPVSLPLWNTIFILPYIQFPWRLLGPLAIVLSLLGAHFWVRTQQIGKAAILVGVVVGVGYSIFWYWPTYAHYPRDYYLNYRQSTTLLDELRPKTFSVEPGHLSPQQPQVIGKGSVTIEKWRGTYRRYTVNAQEGVTVVEPTMYFPGWKILANKKEVAVDAISEYEGQVAYTLPAGEYKIYSYMSQDTVPRILGNTFTLFSGIVLLWQLIKLLNYKRAAQT